MKRLLPILAAVCLLPAALSARGKSDIEPAPLQAPSSFTFTDDLGRSVTVGRCQRTAVLQGSLAALWLLSGGNIACTTKDAFAEPPALSAQEAAALNAQWQTTAFKAHGAGVFALVAAQSGSPAADGSPALIGTMMAPSSELLLAQAPDFVILSANISGHKKLLPLLESAGIPCAYFNYETFSQYLRLLDIFTRLTGRRDRYELHGARVEAACKAQIAQALAKSGR